MSVNKKRLPNINAKESATFRGPSSIQNVISRVTGGSLSRIDGQLKCTIPNANFYLLNPAGVVFGANAFLDIGGSFHVSTADYLRLGNNERFYNNPIAGELLSSASPKALGFLNNTPMPIMSEGKRTDKSSRIFIRAEQFVANIKVTEASISRFMELPRDFMKTSQWITTPCALRAGEKVNRFFISGRDAVAHRFAFNRRSVRIFGKDPSVRYGLLNMQKMSGIVFFRLKM